MKTIIDLHPTQVRNELGNIIKIKEAQEYIPEGDYIVHDFNEMGISLFKDNDFYLIEEWDENDTCKIIRKDEETRINNLIESTFQEILNLIRDGWTEKEDINHPFNIKPYIEKLETYIKIKKTIES